MKLIVGLGNPGKEYQQTRHNVGFMVAEALALRLNAASFRLQAKFQAEVVKVGEVLLVKPQTFMNKSGEAVQKILSFYQISLQDLYVIHDDLDIKLGKYKIKLGIGPKIHNGINSIRTALRNDQFGYVRIGVDNRTTKIPGESYVLNPFNEEEYKIICEVMKQVTDELISRYL